jgi:hypothetical protein
MKIFISHSKDDKILANDFIVLLVAGVGINSNDIFCSSLEGHGVPIGIDFVKHIQDHMKQADVIIPIITSNFMQSQFCLTELGAAWALDKAFPLAVPPIDFEQINTIFGKVQLGLINNVGNLDELKERLEIYLKKESKLGIAKWRMRCEEFLKEFDRKSIVLPGISVREEIVINNPNLIYDSAQQVAFSDFEPFSHYCVGETNGPKGMGEIWLDGQILHIKRKNTEGRFILYLKAYRFKNRIFKFIPAEVGEKRDRIYHVKYKIRAVNGRLSITSFFVNDSIGTPWRNFGGLTKRKEINRPEWQPIEFQTTIDSQNNALLRFDNQGVDREGAEVELKDLTIEII